MQEVFEKIIEELDDLGWVFADYYPDGTEVNRISRKSVPYDEVIEIVKQEAEQYKSTDDWIPTSERVPSKEELGRWAKKCFEVTVYNCGEYKTVPMYYEYTTVRGKEVSRWIWNDRISPWKVIAWKPLPAPYQPKGEQHEKS